MIATLPSSLLAALPIAVAAGFVSFISPCVLPLLPGYLAFLSGAAGSLEGRSGRGRAVVGAIAFIFGFAIVFVSLGALFGGFGALLKDHERGLSIVFGSITCPGSRFSEPVRWAFCSRSDGHRVSVRPSGRSWLSPG